MKDIRSKHRNANATSPIVVIMSMQSWPDHVLNLIVSTATVVAVVAVGLMLVSVGIIYWTGSEMSARAKEKLSGGGGSQIKLAKPSPRGDKPFARQATANPGQAENGLETSGNSEQAKISRLSKVEAELTAARRSDEAKTSRLSQAATELESARRGEQARAIRLSQVEAELMAAQKSDEIKTLWLTRLQAELTAARRSDEAKTSRLSQAATELESARRAEQARATRLSQVEAELMAARRSDETKTLRLAQLEAELTAVRRSGEATALRLSQLEAELVTARLAAEQAKALNNQAQEKQRPRTITPEQRKGFLNAVREMPKGKVMASAFFENEEAQDFAAELLSLLKEAGFDVIESNPLNFFTTARPSGGVRIGCEDVHNAPAQFATVRNGLKALGLDPPATTLVNAEAADVVEIQVTPKP